jgi:hypothetical protein
MSDWLRVSSALSVASFFLVCAAWAAGGWWLVRALFRTRPGEALTTGVAAGFVLFLMGVNLLAGLLTLPGACLASAAMILAGGLAAVRYRRVDWANLRADLSAWPQLLLLVILALLFANAKRGISLFDDYLHLPLVSIMGAGDIPPHFYLNPANGFAYHYGLQIFAAVLEGLAAFFPWSAWDLARGAAIGFTLLLGWVWVKRFTRNRTGATLGSFLYVFGGGTRWLMLLLPAFVLAWASKGVQLTFSGADSGPDLVTALTRPFVIEGQGAMPFPFAYRNGNFEAVFFNLANTGALMFLTVLLLLLLSQTVPSIRRPAGLVVYTLIFASLALSAEHLFALWWGAIVLVLLVRLAFRSSARLRWQPIPRDELLGWAFILGFSALLSLVEGGYITETFRTLLGRLAGSAAPASNVYGFSLRWPPAILNSHLGELSPFNPRQLLVLVLELGPVLLLAPLATRWAWKAARRGQYWQAGLGLAAWLSLAFTLFVEYGVDRSSTRFTGTALWIWLVLAFPAAAFFYRALRPFWKAAAGLGYSATVLSGVVIFAIQITSVPTPVPTYFIAPMDAKFTREFWNQLEPGAQVLDNIPERAVTIFGRAATTSSDIYKPLPVWEDMIAAPDPYTLRAFGFSYAYISRAYWDSLSPPSRQQMMDACVKMVHEETDASGDYRKLLDLRSCRR